MPERFATGGDDCIVVFSDAHVARFWDDMHERAALPVAALNPNSEFGRFVTTVRSRYPSAPLVNLGDGIDYLNAAYGKAPDGAPDNRSLFYGLLGEQLRYHEIPGNHDFRLNPYNLRFWALEHVNVDGRQMAMVADATGQARLRNPVSELRAVLPLWSRQDPLSGFRGYRTATATDLGDWAGVFLNTGPDALTSLRHAAGWAMSNVRRNVSGLLMRRAASTGLSIDSVGLEAPQIEAAATCLREADARPTLVFMHAPLINPRIDRPDISARLDTAHFAQSRREHGLDWYVCASGAGALLDVLQARARSGFNTVIVTGHVHAARYFLIDTADMRFTRVTLDAINQAWNDSRYIKHITVRGIGALGHSPANRATGYGLIEKKGFREIVIRDFRQTAN